MSVSALSRLEKNNELLSAIEVQIRTDPITFYLFLLTLKEDPSLQSLVESMEGECFIWYDEVVQISHGCSHIWP